jgi:hypothetical protein
MATCTYKDCLKAPIPSKCFFYCIHQILQKATPDEKVNIIGLSHTTAQSIYSAINRYSPRDFQELTQYLEPLQIEEIIRVFRIITQNQLDHFR